MEAVVAVSIEEVVGVEEVAEEEVTNVVDMEVDMEEVVAAMAVGIILVVNRVVMVVDTIVVEVAVLQAITSLQVMVIVVAAVVILNKVQDTSLKILVEIRVIAVVNNLEVHSHMVPKVMDNNQLLHRVMVPHQLHMEVSHIVVPQHPVTVLKDIKVLDKVTINLHIKVVDTHKLHNLTEVLEEEAMVVVLLELVDMELHSFPMSVVRAFSGG